jgi:hypothetical protein
VRVRIAARGKFVNAMLAAVVMTGICSPVLAGETGAVAQDAQPQMQAQRDALARKLKLLDRLLGESPAAARIEHSDDAEAQRLLATAGCPQPGDPQVRGGRPRGGGSSD